MKIVLPFHDPLNRKITNPVVSGGTEMFCKLINDNFDTEIVHLEHTESLKKRGANSKKQRENFQKSIINKAEECKADIIVSNFPFSNFSGAIISKSHIPVMYVDHVCFPFPGAIKSMNRLVKNGHSVFLVSKFQQNFYDKMCSRYEMKNIPYDFIIPACCKNKPKILDIEYDCGTIGRCDIFKSPFKLKELTKDKNLKTLVITSKPTLEKNFKYYEKNKNWNDTIWDQPHKKVIEYLSKCGSYFSTLPKETWGITVLEALSCGIPIILNSDKNGNHNSEIIPVNSNHFKKIPFDDKDALVSAIKQFEKIDRKEIQEITLDKYSLENWKNHFINCVSKTIDNFKRSNYGSKIRI